MSEIELGRIAHVDPRTIWENERATSGRTASISHPKQGEAPSGELKCLSVTSRAPHW